MSQCEFLYVHIYWLNRMHLSPKTQPSKIGVYVLNGEGDFSFFHKSTVLASEMAAASLTQQAYEGGVLV